MSLNTVSSRTRSVAKPVTGVATLLLVVLSLLLGPSVGAHEYRETSNIRIYGCALSGKYGCQSHFLRRWNSGSYGILYETRHSHACTDKGGDAQWWKMPRLHISNQGTIIWSQYHDHATGHTTEWCGQSVSVHMWYPNVNSASGWNRWAVGTTQQFPGVFMDCRHEIVNFSGTSDFTGGSNISPAGGNC